MRWWNSDQSRTGVVELPWHAAPEAMRQRRQLGVIELREGLGNRRVERLADLGLQARLLVHADLEVGEHSSWARAVSPVVAPARA
jgi:hypothetical protein